MSSISRTADAGLCGTASRVSSCSASRTAPVADQLLQVAAADDRDDGALTLDVEVDVAVVVQDVEQPLQVVARRVTLGDEQVVLGWSRDTASPCRLGRGRLDDLVVHRSDIIGSATDVWLIAAIPSLLLTLLLDLDRGRAAAGGRRRLWRLPFC